MARQRKRSDETYNARRRYIREAERMLGKANKAMGQAAKRYRTLAREALQNAAELYGSQTNIKRSEQFTRLSNELGVNVREFMRPKSPTQKDIARVESLEKASKAALVSSADMREREARAILNSPIGSRIYGGLVDIWAQPKYENGGLVYRKGQEDIDRAIVEYFGVSSMMDVIEMLEAQGVDLYASPDAVDKYDEVTLAIMTRLFQ